MALKSSAEKEDIKVLCQNWTFEVKDKSFLYFCGEHKSLH